MSKKNSFVCQQCGNDTSKWSGQCNSCNSWNSIVEFVDHGSNSVVAAVAELSRLSDIDNKVAVTKTSSKIAEFDRVLGGGFVPGMTILLGGQPGIGKSTLLTQVIGQFNDSKHEQVLYISAEESLEQVSLRANRLKLVSSKQYLCATTSLEQIIQHINTVNPMMVIIDSIQTIYTTVLSSAAGSVSQVRECAGQLIQLAKQKNIVLLIVGHVTKDGAIAGPRVLEHMVDTVLYFETIDDSRHRMLRAVKNRFGPANELGVFAMTANGLISVKNPSAIFLANFLHNSNGTFITATWEGTRPILVEIQALLDPSQLNNPRRVSVGFDNNRLAMLLAILNKHTNINPTTYDVYLNVVGGIKVAETAADLAVMLCIYTSLHGVNTNKKIIVFGELGLSGEVRPIPYGIERLQEAEKLGFNIAIVPHKNQPNKQYDNLAVHGVANITEALNVIQSI